ncbi:MAG: hypothetical protein JEY99_10375 [Spirochaetales bacterium]|nr:hypothetical protein [Spirochaetales bacterium]
MRNTILSIALTIFCFFTFSISAENSLGSVDSWLSNLQGGDFQKLIETGELSRELENGTPLTLLPTSENIDWTTDRKEGIDKIRDEMKRYFGIEGLFFVDEDHSNLTEEEVERLKIDVYNLTRGVSSLEGADYYSASRGHRHPLFYQFYRIEKAGDKERLTDPLVEIIPERDSFLVFQEDSTFGEDEYEITYNFRDPAISLTMKNTTSINYSFLPIAGKEKLYLHVEIIPVQAGYIFYGAALIEGRKIPIPGKNINDSLYNRIKALMEWFTRRLQTEI